MNYSSYYDIHNYVHILCLSTKAFLLRAVQRPNYFHPDVLKSEIAIKYALIVGYFDVVEVLLSKGAPVDEIDYKLIVAYGNRKCIELASSRVKENENVTFSFSNTIRPYFHPFDINIAGEPLNNFLYKRGFDSDFIPLYHAIRSRRIDVIEAVLEYGADPCKPFYREESVITPLKKAFSLQPPAVELIIKYAALKIKSVSEREQFYDNFKVRQHKVRSFLRFAERCVIEVEILKQLELDSSKVTLYSFIMAKGESLKVMFASSEVKRKVTNVLVSSSLPIYMPLIVKNIERKIIFDALCMLPHPRWNSIFGNVDLDCIINILKLLCRTDLINLWKALH